MRDVPTAKNKNGGATLSNSANDARQRGPLRVRAPQDLVGGVALIGVCVFVFWAANNLKVGTFESMGPGMFPHILGSLLGLGGVFLVVKSFLSDGDPVGKLAFRGPVLVIAGIVTFSFTIRSMGLAIAGVLALCISGFATEEARPREVVIFAVATTLGCIILFRYLLGMAVPVLTIPGTSIDF